MESVARTTYQYGQFLHTFDNAMEEMTLCVPVTTIIVEVHSGGHNEQVPAAVTSEDAQTPLIMLVIAIGTKFVRGFLHSVPHLVCFLHSPTLCMVSLTTLFPPFPNSVHGFTDQAVSSIPQLCA